MKMDGCNHYGQVGRHVEKRLKVEDTKHQGKALSRPSMLHMTLPISIKISNNRGVNRKRRKDGRISEDGWNSLALPFPGLF